MKDISIRKEGRAGRITLDRPKALNALTWEMCLQIEKALDTWALDASLDLILIDAVGEKAFCAGGDIQEMYATGKAGDFDYGRRFWRDEYRMNAKLFRFPKPVVTLMQGFTMGGGVGVGCHGSHRVVGASSKIAMPEVGIGLVPDVGGSLILARAPGRIGEYLGLTADRMDAGDAIFAGFADYFVPEERWPQLASDLCATGDVSAVDRAAAPAPHARLADWQTDIDPVFDAAALEDIQAAGTASPALERGLDLMSKNSPLSMAYALELIQKVREADTIEAALTHEFRFTARAMEHGDFIEGIRAAVIDKDRAPNWRSAGSLAPFAPPVTPELELG